MFTTYHNHSNWSDGAASIREMALAAKAAGAGEFGISDHLVVGPRDFFEDARYWSMGLQSFPLYVAEAQKVKAELETEDFHVRIGVETDFFPETAEKVNRFLAQFPLDYIIGAVHFAGNFPIDCRAEFWQSATPDQRDFLWRKYVRRISQCAEELSCDWLAHLDLAKKFGFLPSETCVAELEMLLERCARKGMPIEVNTAGWDKTCAEAYPSPRLLKKAVECGVGILVNADAHATSQIVRHFDEARRQLAALDLKEVVAFEGRRSRSIPL
ncbi:MAG: histidinol-phosphatase [Lentisphaeria bacterium]|nr:histidinol-phosphatase [Lentisphaeria bacterium]